MFKIGERLKVSDNHPYFHNMSETWIYNGYKYDLHSIRHPTTRKEYNLIMTSTLERNFKRVAPSQLENK